jgi:hypothetical protein
MTKKSPAARFANIRDENSHEYPVRSAPPAPPAQAAAPSSAPPAELTATAAVAQATLPMHEARKGRGKPEAASRAPSRSGKVGMQLWVEADVRRRLKLYATAHDRSLEDVLGEAVADFLRTNLA